MAAVDLLFRQPSTGVPASLVFGVLEELPDRQFLISATLPPPTFAIQIVGTREVVVSFSLPPPTFSITASYSSSTERPTVSRAISSWQVAQAAEVGAQDAFDDAARTVAGAEAEHAEAMPLRAAAIGRHQDGIHTERGAVTVRHQIAQPVPPVSTRAGHQDMLRHARPQARVSHQEADPRRVGSSTDWQDRYRDRRPTLASRYQEARRLHSLGLREDWQPGVPLRRSWRARHQWAMRPPAGRHPRPLPPPPDPCYIPGLPSPLVFEALASDSASLLFFCERHPDPEGPPATTIIPVRSVYVVFNSFTLYRLPSGPYIDATAFSLSIDADSWSYSWSATVPGNVYEDIKPDTDGTPVLLEATINGIAYTLLAEQITRERTHGSARHQIKGRGRNALLADPYDPIKTFAGTSTMTAEQLMLDVLTESGVPIGWDVDFGLTDWLIPADTWTHRGTRQTALQEIAEAAGGYLQPHRTDETWRVLHRYPQAPWDWGSVTPDFEIPAAVAVREGFEWAEHPRYNRIYVSGQRNGVLGRVTRTGSAGDFSAPMVVHPLITAEEVARQRGRAELSLGGRRNSIVLSMPVLPESGIIEPGNFVRYLDGTEPHIGLVRSLSLSVSGDDKRLVVRQSLGVVSHVAP